MFKWGCKQCSLGINRKKNQRALGLVKLDLEKEFTDVNKGSFLTTRNFNRVNTEPGQWPVNNYGSSLGKAPSSGIGDSVKNCGE